MPEENHISLGGLITVGVDVILAKKVPEFVQKSKLNLSGVLVMVVHYLHWSRFF